MSNFTKDDFIRAMAEEKGLTLKEARESTNNVLDTILDVSSKLQNGEKLDFSGYFKVYVKDTPARKGHNPQTGEEIDIPAGKQVRVSPGAKIKRAVKGE